MNETLKNVTGMAIWDPTYTATILYCLACFNERLTAVEAVALGDRVNELISSGNDGDCFNCGEVLS